MDTAQSIQYLFNETRFPGRKKPTVPVAPPKPQRAMHDYTKCLPAGTPGEHAACVIRAAIVASGEDPVRITEKLQPYRYKGRGGRLGGINAFYYRPVLEALGFKCQTYLSKDNPFGAYKKPTVAQFIAQHPKGRWFVTVSGHAFAIIDGEVHDWPGLRPKNRRKLLEWHRLEEA